MERDRWPHPTTRTRVGTQINRRCRRPSILGIDALRFHMVFREDIFMITRKRALSQAEDLLTKATASATR
jgi:hypothetical protein